MTIYSPFGYFVVLAALLLFIRLPLFSSADRKWHVSTSRTVTLDGLRGYLAIGVFVHHATIYYGLLANGTWDNPASWFYTRLGPIAVAFFFMITGYLFWGKVVASEGRPGWRKLYIGRAFRIGPLYLLATAVMLFIIFLKTGFALLEPPLTVLKEIFPLLFLGLFEPGNSINTYGSPKTIIAAVTWTLHYEWIFYLVVLPLSALFARKRSFHIVFSVAGLLISLTMVALHNGSSNSPLIADFFIGMTCASLQQYNLFASLSDKVKSFAAIAMLWFVFFGYQGAPDIFQVVLTGSVFFLVVNGCTLFGALVNKSAQRLGEISYGIYLLQGLVLFIFAEMPQVRTIAIATHLNYWMLVITEGLALTFVAFITYSFIEKPGIATGKRLSSRLSWRHEPSHDAHAPVATPINSARAD